VLEQWATLPEGFYTSLGGSPPKGGGGGAGGKPVGIGAPGSRGGLREALDAVASRGAFGVGAFGDFTRRVLHEFRGFTP